MTIRLEKPKNFHEALILVTEDTKKLNIDFDCGTTKGNAAGHGFAGQYVVCADHISLTVTKKLFLISDSKVAKEVKKYWALVCAQVERGYIT